MKVKLNGHKLDDIKRKEKITKTNKEKIKTTNKHKSKRKIHLKSLQIMVKSMKNSRLRHKFNKRKLSKYDF